MILTALIGLLLPACHSQKAATSSAETVDTPDTTRVESVHRPIRVLYGIPPEVYQMREERAAEAAKDSANMVE